MENANYIDQIIPSNIRDHILMADFRVRVSITTMTGKNTAVIFKMINFTAMVYYIIQMEPYNIKVSIVMI